MRHLTAIAVSTLVLVASPLLAQAPDPHAGHHPQGTAPAPGIQPAPAPGPVPSDKPCPMMNRHGNGGMSAGSRGMKAMRGQMKMCMDAPDKEAGPPADPHKH